MPAERQDLHCRILCVRTEPLDRHWRHALGHPWWRLYRNEADGVAIRHPDGILRVPAGRLCLVPAWGRFAGSCTGTMRQFYVHFDPVGWDRAWVQRAFTAPFLAAPDAGRDGFLAGLGETVSAADYLRIQSELLRLLAEAVHGLPPALRDELEQHDDDLGPALAEIEAFFAQPISLVRLSTRCGLSPDHFSRKFRSRFARSPMDYLQERRVSVAAERLRTTNDTIDSVATSVGFANRFHFSRVFTRVLGTAPATWRRTAAEAEVEAAVKV